MNSLLPEAPSHQGKVSIPIKTDCQGATIILPEKEQDALKDVITVFWFQGKYSPGSIVVNSVWSSRILSSHFSGMPLMPWVLSTKLLMDLEHYPISTIHNIKRKFLKAIPPGTTLKKRDDWETASLGTAPISEFGNEEPVYQQFTPLTQFTSSTEFPVFEYKKPENLSSYRLDEGKKWIPHGDDFRFVDKVGVNWDTLIGVYKTTDIYTENGKIPFWLIEESCAQSMLGALRLWKDENADYGTYSEAESRGSNEFAQMVESVKPGSLITCVWKCFPIQDEKGRTTQFRFQYSCYIEERLLFQGNIIGNAISRKAWERMTKKSPQT